MSFQKEIYTKGGLKSPQNFRKIKIESCDCEKNPAVIAAALGFCFDKDFKKFINNTELDKFIGLTFKQICWGCGTISAYYIKNIKPTCENSCFYEIDVKKITDNEQKKKVYNRFIELDVLHQCIILTLGVFPLLPLDLNYDFNNLEIRDVGCDENMKCNCIKSVKWRYIGIDMCRDRYDKVRLDMKGFINKKHI